MLHLGLSAANMRSYVKTLLTTHEVRMQVRILDGDESTIGVLDGIVSGTVSIDTTADVTRSLDLVVTNPGRKFHFAPQSPSESAVFADNFIQVRHGVYVDDIGDWVYCPVFTGPIATVMYDDATVEVTALGKESLALDPHFAWTVPASGRTLHKGRSSAGAIRDLLTNLGETKFGFDDTEHKLPKHIAVPRTAEPWKVARNIAKGANRQLYYDGRGVARLRRQPAKAQHVFKDGDGGGLLTRPQITYDLSTVRNVVQVTGSDPRDKSGKKKVIVVRTETHGPLSPGALARHGTPRYLVDEVQASALSKHDPVKQATDIADQHLRNGTTVLADAQFDALPMPFLEEEDMVATHYNGEYVLSRLSTFAIPLTGTDPMSVGFLRHTAFRGHGN